MPTAFLTRSGLAAATLCAALICPALISPACAAEDALPAPPEPVSHPVPADKAADYLRLPSGLRLELVACEPQVIDPVAMRFDERGRLWVVEMRDYPHGPAEGEPPASRIRILEDKDGDGRFEQSTVFADQLLFVTGVQPWEGGAFVTLAGRVAYMKDTNGDGRADQEETWFTGFVEENSQLRANHPRLALDNHIYIANGLRGGEIADAREPDKKVSISGRDFRFNPRTRAFEAVTGVGQFGLTFDDFGNRFVCSNRNPAIHIVLKDRYLQLNPLAAIAGATHDVAAAGEASRIYPLSRAWTTSNLHAGQFTAACGVHLHRGDALPAEYYGNVFTCDPTGNLVHREIVRPAGATFAGRPAVEGAEFLASTDEWFRPVNLEAGPDGALYLIDMHRAVIEHPQFMPTELKDRPDLRHGDDCGRIYRIVAARDEPPRAREDKLAERSPQELVSLLEHPNAWQRETAARLLLERRDRSAVEPLRSLATASRSPAARSHALWLLEGLEAIDEPTLRAILEKDGDARVREQALVLAEPLAEGALETRQAAWALSRHPDARLRFQLALSLAPAKEAEDVAALARIALAGAEDVWTRRAVTVAARDVAAETLATLLAVAAAERRAPTPAEIETVAELASLTGAGRQPAQVNAALEALAKVEGPAAPQIRLVCLTALADAAARRGGPLSKLTEQAPQAARQMVDEAFAHASELALDRPGPLQWRLAAIRLLIHDPNSAEALSQLALEEPDQTVRREAIAALARKSDGDVWRKLLAGFAQESPSIRSALLDGALARPERVALLLDAVERGEVRPGEIDAARASRLLKHSQEDLRRRAAQLFADAVPADRQRVLAEYEPALRLTGDPIHGKEVFRKSCANCHRVGDVGVNVAPDISDSRVKEPRQILTDILQPNRAIDNNYISYTVITADGRSLTGILATETASSITLRQPEDKTVTLLRSDIEEMRSNGVSLMPEGLERDIPLQDMADLISYIKNWRYLDGRIPLAK